VASVEASTNIDLGTSVQRRLLDCERRVFRKWEDRILQAFKAAWTGWLYIGRPASAQRDVSWKAWHSKIETADANTVVLRVFNTEDYSSFVHRSGSTVIEWQRIWADVQARMLPGLVADLEAEITKNLSAPVAPKKLGARGGGTTVTRGTSL
jgi:hypothetical protein